ncbi:MAG: cobalamin-binding protein [Pseudomonadota bacterium]
MRRTLCLLVLLPLLARAATVAPQRIVTLAPHLTELVFAAGAGDRIVGTLDTSDYPAAARRIPRIGDVQHIDAERLLALQPDLVLEWGDGQPASEHALITRLHVSSLALEQHALEDVPASLERLGRLFGTAPIADAEAARWRRELAALRNRYSGARHLRVFWQVWSAPLFTLGGHHVATEMLQVCGADNIFAEQTLSAVAVDEEAVLARHPDVLVLTGTVAENADWLRRWNARVPPVALRTGAVIALDPDLVNRTGPRLLQGTQLLCERLAALRVAHP